MQLNSVRAVVTGGVSGLGLAVAQHLVANGGKVALFDVNDDKGAASVAELGDGNARYFRTDVTDDGVTEASARDTWIGGYPLLVPMLDVHAIGAGGGSIAYVDEGGAFRVGPRSAGATPHHQVPYRT